MVGGRIQLSAIGRQDVVLTGSPQVSFYKVLYRRHTNFSMECMGIPSNVHDGPKPGMLVSYTIPRSGDLLTNATLKVELPRPAPIGKTEFAVNRFGFFTHDKSSGQAFRIFAYQDDTQLFAQTSTEPIRYLRTLRQYEPVTVSPKIDEMIFSDKPMGRDWYSPVKDDNNELIGYPLEKYQHYTHVRGKHFMNRVLFQPPYKESGALQDLVVLAYANHTHVRVFADTVLQHEFVIHKHETRTVTVDKTGRKRAFKVLADKDVSVFVYDNRDNKYSFSVVFPSSRELVLPWISSVLNNHNYQPNAFVLDTENPSAELDFIIHAKFSDGYQHTYETIPSGNYPIHYNVNSTTPITYKNNNNFTILTRDADADGNIDRERYTGLNVGHVFCHLKLDDSVPSHILLSAQAASGQTSAGVLFGVPIHYLSDRVIVPSTVSIIRGIYGIQYGDEGSNEFRSAPVTFSDSDTPFEGADTPFEFDTQTFDDGTKLCIYTNFNKTSPDIELSSEHTRFFVFSELYAPLPGEYRSKPELLIGNTPDLRFEPANRYVDSIGHALIEYAELEIGGQRIDRHTGEWLDAWSELSVPEEKRHGFKHMIGKTDFGDDHGPTSLETFLDWSIDDVNAYPIRVHVPLQFFFCRNPGQALPLVCLPNQDVKINIKFRDANRLHVFSTDPLVDQFQDVQLLCNYVFLDHAERARFVRGSSHEYLIDQVQHAGPLSTSSDTVVLDFQHPVKELVWMIRNAGHGLFEYGFGDTGNDTFVSGGLILNGRPRFADRDAAYFRLSQPYEHHTRVPTKHVYCYSFALNPEAHQPTGSCNFSRLDKAFLHLHGMKQKTNGDGELLLYAVSHNLLRVEGGTARLAFHV